MNKMLLICLMILALTAGCASTGSDTGGKLNPGEIMQEQVEIDQMH